MAIEKLDILVINNLHPQDSSGFNEPLTELFTDFSEARVETINYTEVQHGELRGDQHDLVIASGVRNSDEYPADMIYDLFDYLQDVLDNNQSLFTVCAAYQALHVMRGGRLGKLPKPETGLVPLSITEPVNPLFTAVEAGSLIDNNHSYYVSRPGAGLRRIASTTASSEAISSSDDDRVSGSQGHIERSGIVGRQIASNILQRTRTFSDCSVIDLSSLQTAAPIVEVAPLGVPAA